MAAEKGNKYAEKWTKDATIELIENCQASIKDDCYFLSEVAVAVDQYPELFTYLIQKFEDDADVFQAIKRLYAKVESLITRKTADGKINVALGIFILKSYHNLIETSKLQSEHSGSVGLTWNETKTYDPNQETNTGN
jgi:hypothetical protein